MIRLEEYPPLDVAPVGYVVIRTYCVQNKVLGSTLDTVTDYFYIGANEADSEEEMYEIFNAKTKIIHCEKIRVFLKNP